MELLDYIEKNRTPLLSKSTGNVDNEIYDAESLSMVDEWDNNFEGKGALVTMIRLVTNETNYYHLNNKANQPRHSQSSSHNMMNRDLLHGNNTVLSSDTTDKLTSLTGLCLDYSSSSSMFITLQECNPKKYSQWFKIAGCTPGFELVMNDGDMCPSFHREAKDVKGAKEEEAFCSIVVGGESVFDSDSSNKSSSSPVLCVDISGENPSFGVPLIGYECTGRWNQLFRLGANCSVFATQPEMIGRVRNTDFNNNDNNDVHLCLEGLNSTSSVVFTGPCLHNENEMKQFDFSYYGVTLPSPLNDEHDKEVNSEDEHVARNLILNELIQSHHQRFEFLSAADMGWHQT
eukprot:gene12610-16907_t